jgi:hypothetical protein
MHRFIGWAGGLLLYSVAVSSSLSGEPFRISVREKGTGWPVPLIELRTTDHYRWVTDNAGVVAFDLPEAMGHTTWLSVSGHGYGAYRFIRPREARLKSKSFARMSRSALDD